MVEVEEIGLSIEDTEDAPLAATLSELPGTRKPDGVVCHFVGLMSCIFDELKNIFETKAGILTGCRELALRNRWIDRCCGMP